MPAMPTSPIEAGHYWLRSRRTGRWTVAYFDGSDILQWTFLGTDCTFETEELFEENGDSDSFTLGPRVDEPSQLERHPDAAGTDYEVIGEVRLERHVVRGVRESSTG